MIESEKVLERKLKAAIEEIGGLCLKLSALHFAGIPDRICLFPDRPAFFVEVKTTGMKPSPVQKVVHRKLRRLKFRVEIVDCTGDINQIIDEL